MFFNNPFNSACNRSDDKFPALPFCDDENEQGRPSISTTDPLLDLPTLLWDSTAALLLAVKIAKCKEALNKAPDNTSCPPTSDPSEPLSYRGDINFGSSTTSNIGIVGQLSQQGFTKDAFEDSSRDKAAVQWNASSSTRISLDPPKRDTLVRDRSLMEQELIKVNEEDALKKPPPQKRILPAITTVPSQSALLDSSSRPKNTKLLVRDTLLVSCLSPSRSRRKFGTELLSPRNKPPKTSRRSPSPVSSPTRSSNRKSRPLTEKKNISGSDRASSSRSRRRSKADSNPRRSSTPSSKHLSSKAGIDSPLSRPRVVSPFSAIPSPRPEQRASILVVVAESPSRQPSKLAFDAGGGPSSPGKVRRRSSTTVGVDSPASRPTRQQLAADIEYPPPGSTRARRRSSTGAASDSAQRRPTRKLAVALECPSPGRAHRRSSTGADSPLQRGLPRHQLAVDIEECPAFPRVLHTRSSTGADSPSQRASKLAIATDPLEFPSPRSRRSSGKSPPRQPTKASYGDLEINSPRPRRSPTIYIGCASPRCPRTSDNENMRSRKSKSRRALSSPRAKQTEENARRASSSAPQVKEQERPISNTSEEDSRTRSKECRDIVEHASGRQSHRKRLDLEKVDYVETLGDCASSEYPLLAPTLTPRARRKSRVVCDVPAALFDDSPTQLGTTVVPTNLPPATPRSQKRRVSGALLLHDASEERANNTNKSIAKARREVSYRQAQITIDI